MAVYVSSDWHGAHWAWTAVKEFLKPDDKLYFLGDACDRGEGLNGDGGWSMLKEMLDDPRVEYILGNHDNFLIEKNDYLAWINGGTATLDAMLNDLEGEKYRNKLKELYHYDTYIRPDGKKVFMSHSGYTDTADEYELMWDRNEYLTILNFTDYDYVIHGHTPAPYIEEELKGLNNYLSEDKKIAVPVYENGAYWYSSWRCCVDCATITSNQIVLLDLDTFDEHIFEAPTA